jgi:hypothetical protein
MKRAVEEYKLGKSAASRKIRYRRIIYRIAESVVEIKE